MPTHVAHEVGISIPNVLTGDRLRESSEEALRRRVDEVDIVAEIEPTQKERIVRAFSRSTSARTFLRRSRSRGR